MTGPRRQGWRRWADLYAAIVLDIVGVFLLAGADGLRRPGLAGLAIVVFTFEVVAFARALRAIEASVAYALYGLGTAVVATISMAGLGERATPLKVAVVAAIVVGTIILNTAGQRADDEVSPVARRRWTRNHPARATTTAMDA